MAIAGALIVGRAGPPRIEVAAAQTAPTTAQPWSDPATWGGRVPAQGDTVTIPAGKAVLLDVSPPALAGLEIDGSLVFDERDLNLTSDWIAVFGLFQVGTAAQPFAHRAVITLTGNDPTQDIMGMGTKVLGVMGGTLELHGRPTTATWTRLNVTAPAGATSITLERAVNWLPGDRIVVASTDYNAAQTEEAVIKSVSGTKVTLSAPLKYMHWGVTQTYAGATLDERAEVGLLSHNIVVQGDADSETSGFGGHMMVHTTGTAHIENALFYRMGQKQRLARYPIHFHGVGDGAGGSWVKNSSVWRSFNRCVTIHDSNNILLQGNVGYDAIGHCYFFESGSETGNTLDGNLGLLTRRPAAGEELLPSDKSPATYWVTNPDNTLKNNVAAGSANFGFWYALPEHPTSAAGPDPEGANIWPRRTPLRAFANNVAHSNGDTGLFVDRGPAPDGTTATATNYSPHVNPVPPPPGQPDSPPAIADFTGLTAYKNRTRAVWLRGTSQQVTAARLADNAIGATFAASDVAIKNSVIVGESANKGTPPPWETKGLDGRSLPRPWEAAFPIRGYEFYDGKVGAQGVTFVNFQPNSQRQASGLGVLLKDRFALDPRNYVDGVTFVNANQVYLQTPEPGRDGDGSALFVDTSGSVTGTAGRQVVTNDPFLLTPACISRTAWNAWVCNNPYGRLTIQNRDASAVAMTPVTVRRNDSGASVGLTGTATSPDISTSVTTNLIAGKTYTTSFGGGEPGKLRLSLRFRPGGDWVRLAIPRTTNTFFVYRDYGTYRPLGAAASLAALDASAGDVYYWDSTAGMLYVKMQVQTVAGRDFAVIDVCPTLKCQ